MKNDLEICIEHFSEELEKLESLIQACISEGDYLGAHYHSMAREKTNLQFHQLTSIKYKNYSKRLFLQIEINRLKDIRRALDHKQSKIYRKEQIDQEIKNLEYLYSEIAPHGLDTQVLVDELNNLLDHTLANITLILKEKPALKLQFYLKGKDLILNLLEGVEQVKLKSFLHLGFELFNAQLLLRVPEFRQIKINEVVELCSRIIYEGCFNIELDKEMKLICH